MALVGGVAVVGIGIGIALATARPQPTASQPVKGQTLTLHHKITKHHHKTPKPATPFVPPATTPVIPSAGQSRGANAQASLSAVTQKEGVTTPVGPIDIVANLANPTQKWAFATLAAKGASTGYTLWFGEQNTANGPWAWVPSTLPGALSQKLPPAVYSALQWAYDAHTGQSGPGLNGTVSWQAISGLVGEPVAWVASESNGSLMITVWVPSYTGTPAYYGIQTVWYPDTIAAGQQGLSMILPSLPGQTKLAQIAQNPSP